MPLYNPSNGEPHVVLSASVTLDDDDIKALGTVPITLVAAPGAGSVLRFQGADLILDPSAGAYTFAGDRLMLIDNGSGALLGGPAYEESSEAYPLLANNSTEIIAMTMGPRFFRGGDGSLLSTMENTPIVLRTVGAIAGGNAANFMKVTVYYSVIEL